MDENRDAEQIAEDGTTACGDGCTGDGRALVWMLDLDDRDLPWRAHQVVSQTATTAVTVCGRTETAWTHPRGWWTTHPGELPLAEHAIHCQRAPG